VMRLSMESYELYKRFGDEKAILMLKEAGFDCIDYSFFWLEDQDPALGENYIAHAKEVRRLLEENGMTCNQAHAPFDMTYDDQLDLTNKEYVKVVRAIEAAAIMGAKNIIVHAIKTPKPEYFFERNLLYYKSLEPYCRKFGICVAIENLFHFDQKRDYCLGVLHTPQLLRELIEALDSPWFVVCIDVGHAALTGYEPEDMILSLDKDILKALHIHDNDYRRDDHRLPYTGSFCWNNIMSALKK